MPDSARKALHSAASEKPSNSCTNSSANDGLYLRNREDSGLTSNRSTQEKTGSLEGHTAIVPVILVAEIYDKI